eukprot:SAG31_NODE_1811_length_7219_cov_1.768118_3_plen_240_part_00
MHILGFISPGAQAPHYVFCTLLEREKEAERRQRERRVFNRLRQKGELLEQVGFDGAPGNFDSQRFSKWFRWLCKKLSELTGGEGVDIHMDGATYHKLCTNPRPTKSGKRPDMVSYIEQLQAELNVELATAGQLRTGGLTWPQLFEIISQNAPEKKYEVFDIASEYNHTVRFTPPYCHRSAPIEIFWANVEKPLARRSSHSINDLMVRVKASVNNTVKEKTLLAWRIREREAVGERNVPP